MQKFKQTDKTLPEKRTFWNNWHHVAKMSIPRQLERQGLVWWPCLKFCHGWSTSSFLSIKRMKDRSWLILLFVVVLSDYLKSLKDNPLTTPSHQKMLCCWHKVVKRWQADDIKSSKDTDDWPKTKLKTNWWLMYHICVWMVQSMVAWQVTSRHNKRPYHEHRNKWKIQYHPMLWHQHDACFLLWVHDVSGLNNPGIQ